MASSEKRQDFAHQAEVLPHLLAGDYALAWDPGVGKSRPCLRAGALLEKSQLIIAPAHLRDTWAEAAAKDVPSRRVTILVDTKAVLPKPLENDIFIISYEYAKTLARWKELRAIWWGSIVIDEAHYLARHRTARTRAILGEKFGGKTGLIFRSRNVWPISGTFIGGYPDEIFPLLRHLFPRAVLSNNLGTKPGKRYMDMGEFIRTFCVTAENDFGGEKVVGGKNYDELKRRIEPYFSRIKLMDATTLPALLVDTIPIRGYLGDLTKGLTSEQLTRHTALLNVMKCDIHEEDKLEILNNSAVMLAELRHAIAMVKIGAVEEIIRNELASGVDKILVFGWHREPLQTLYRRFGNSELILGGMSSDKRQRSLDLFDVAPDNFVLFGQIGAMGSGLNIQCAHRTIFLEASWSTRDNRQAIHRTYRIGQTKPCHVSFVSLIGSIDEYVAKILAHKAKSVAKALD